MKTFKRYITEVWGQEKISLLIFSPGTAKQEAFIPLSKPMMKRMFPQKAEEMMGVHVTDMNGIKNLIKIQGSKKAIATMMTPNASQFERGVATDGGYVAVLKGYPLLTSPSDLESRVDQQGRRWVAIERLFNSPSGYDGKVMRKFDDMKENVFKKATSGVKFPSFLGIREFADLYKLSEDWLTHPDYDRNLYGPKEEYAELQKPFKKVLGKAIGMFFQEVEKFLIANMDAFRPCLHAYPKAMSNNDELVLNGIKIDRVYVVLGHDMEEYNRSQEKFVGTNRSTKFMKMTREMDTGHDAWDISRILKKELKQFNTGKMCA